PVLRVHDVTGELFLSWKIRAEALRVGVVTGCVVDSPSPHDALPCLTNNGDSVEVQVRAPIRIFHPGLQMQSLQGTSIACNIAGVLLDVAALAQCSLMRPRSERKAEGCHV